MIITYLLFKDDTLAEATEIDGFMERPYGKLSGGQRRRADILEIELDTILDALPVLH